MALALLLLGAVAGYQFRKPEVIEKRIEVIRHVRVAAERVEVQPGGRVIETPGGGREIIGPVVLTTTVHEASTTQVVESRIVKIPPSRFAVGVAALVPNASWNFDAGVRVARVLWFDISSFGVIETRSLGSLTPARFGVGLRIAW